MRGVVSCGTKFPYLAHRNIFLFILRGHRLYVGVGACIGQMAVSADITGRSRFLAKGSLGKILGQSFSSRSYVALNNESEIDVTLGWDGIIWPWYINAPVSLGVRYCF